MWSTLFDHLFVDENVILKFNLVPKTLYKLYKKWDVNLMLQLNTIDTGIL